jgi:hypothetical protein
VTLPVWLEVHVDDVALADASVAAASDRWADTAGTLSTLAARAEDAGARLSFRVRERFATLDTSGFLAGLVARGHEVGWHAHGSRLRAARDAVVRAGGTARVAAPGLVQSGERGRIALLEEARALGARTITDRVEARVFAYQGWLAWAPIDGVVALDVSVSPFDWGVLVRRGRRVEPGRLDVDALARRIAAQERRVPPPGATPFFGATFHEHDVMGPRAPALDALARLLDRLGPRVVTSGAVAGGGAGADDGTIGAGGGGAGGIGRGADGIGSGTWAGGLAPPVRRVALAIERRLAPRIADRAITVGARTVRARRIGPADAAAVLVLVHGGGSGIAQGVGFLGLRDAAVADAGLAAWSFDRSDSFRTPGNPVHAADTRAVLAAALAEGRPTALVTWSAGLVPALRAALALADPRLVLLVDAEGPADRFSLLPPGQPDHELAALDPWDDAAWAGREAVALVGAFPGRYLRLQAEIDHVHGRMSWHAHRMVAAARRGALNGGGGLLPGRLDAHGERLLGWIRAALAAASTPSPDPAGPPR